MIIVVHCNPGQSMTIWLYDSVITVSRRRRRTWPLWVCWCAQPVLLFSFALCREEMVEWKSPGVVFLRKCSVCLSQMRRSGQWLNCTQLQRCDLFCSHLLSVAHESLFRGKLLWVAFFSQINVSHGTCELHVCGGRELVYIPKIFYNVF